MRAHPATTYVRAGPQTWGRIREAYLSGLSAPTVAARFGVSVAAIRKRAAREGWTKAAMGDASRAPSWRGAAPGPGGEAALPDRLVAAEQPVVEAFRIPLALHPRTLARQSLARAAHALREGRALDAQRMAHAAEAVLRVEARVDWWPEDGEEIDDDGREALLVQFVRSIAVDVAVKLARGQPLPAAYADLAAEYADAMAGNGQRAQSG
ncbi:hypothetical protein [Brevundimonas sp.]|uniref:hypothetical protein n=1 Tax=Brevundimonas sp. TaxID=1871086 RepID=UPI00198C07EC|nr:hypothetical protein [Brevundimonas sp.]MBD3836423.1 hypothetical protein [Brevundimonas sp.]